MKIMRIWKLCLNKNEKTMCLRNMKNNNNNNKMCLKNENTIFFLKAQNGIEIMTRFFEKISLF